MATNVGTVKRLKISKHSKVNPIQLTAFFQYVSKWSQQIFWRSASINFFSVPETDWSPLTSLMRLFRVLMCCIPCSDTRTPSMMRYLVGRGGRGSGMRGTGGGGRGIGGGGLAGFSGSGGAGGTEILNDSYWIHLVCPKIIVTLETITTESKIFKFQYH